MQERRSEIRMLCADMVEVAWVDPSGRRHKAMGLLEDISASGACLQLENSIPLGVPIRWRTPRHQFEGEVRFCVYREIVFFVGVEFLPGSSWSKRIFKPQHLLDLKRLMGKAGG
jgi:hypothetical protein